MKKMKKIILSIALSLIVSASFAQGFQFTKSDGTPIINGSIVSYDAIGSYLNFRIKNTSTIPLDIKIKCTSLVNTDGTQFELCYGDCFASVIENGIYPDFQNILQPNQSNPVNGDHFVNNNPGTGAVVDYVFKLYAVGAESEGITFTYRYNNPLSSTSFQELSLIGITPVNTIIQNDFNFNTAVSGNITIVNLNGQEIAKKSFTEGAQNISLSHLSTGVYIAQFQTLEGKTSQIKVIKK